MDKTELRICTITHHTVPNYGAVLQAYALQKVIEELGYFSEVLDYRPIRVKRFYHQSLLSQNNIKEILRHILYYKRFKKWNKPFQDFVKDNIRTSRTYSENNIACAGDKYDLYISGSDQVWNLSLHQGKTRYLLDFVKNDKAKGSYGASFGYSKIPKQYVQLTKELLSRFSYINVREKKGADIVRDMFDGNVQINQVLDPTMILDRDVWDSLTSAVDDSGYILVYEICRLKESFEYALELSKATGKKIISIQSFENQHLIESDRIKYLYAVNPCMFLSLIKYADYVVTSSFHGTVFSVLFQRPFFCTLTNNKSGTNTRIESLLEVTGLSDRLTGTVDYDKSIDYSVVAKRLNAEKERSLAVLKDMLENRCREVQNESRA